MYPISFSGPVTLAIALLAIFFLPPASANAWMTPPRPQAPQAATPQATVEGYQVTIPAMGVRFRLEFYCESAEKAEAAVASSRQLLADLEHTFTDYDSSSEAMRLCYLNSGDRFPASFHFLELAQLSQQLTRKTNGCFDATLGEITQLWRTRRRHPDQAESLEQPLELARQALQQRDKPLFKIDLPHGVFQKGPSRFRFDFGGIAKGYAADQLLEHLRTEYAIQSALIDASGDVTTSNPPPGQAGWQVGLSQIDPDQGLLHRIHLAHYSVASSGDARQFWKSGERRESHLLDPRSGQSLPGHHLTIAAHPRGDIADALASALSVCRQDEFQQIADRFPELAAIRLQRTPEGDLKVDQTDNWEDWLNLHLLEQPSEGSVDRKSNGKTGR